MGCALGHGRDFMFELIVATRLTHLIAPEISPLTSFDYFLESFMTFLAN